MEARQTDCIPERPIPGRISCLLPGRALAGLYVHRVREGGRICAALPRAGRDVEDLDRRRYVSHLVSKQQGIVLPNRGSKDQGGRLYGCGSFVSRRQAAIVLRRADYRSGTTSELRPALGRLTIR